MKRLHVNLAVDDLAESVRFYTALFAAEPAVLKPDYAKWMLEDPRVNFAVTTLGCPSGIDHLGIQAETEEELQEVQRRLAAAARPVLDQGEVACCYAQSAKSWTTDPQGLAWEAFLTRGDSATFGAGGDRHALSEGKPCCTPELDGSAAIAPKASCGC